MSFKCPLLHSSSKKAEIPGVLGLGNIYVFDVERNVVL
jgi:hypothetical protein